MKQALIDAAMQGDLNEVKHLLDQGADVNAVTNGRYPWTPLMHAAREGHAEIVHGLLDRDADVKHQDLDFFDALTLAARRGHWSIARRLIEAGADPRHADGYGHSALDYARRAGQTDLVVEIRALTVEDSCKRDDHGR